MKNIPTIHNSAKKSDFAKTVLMPGDPLRSKYIAKKYLTDAVLVNDLRGIQGYTGFYKGKKVSVMAHGMGMPSMAIYAHELFAFYGVKNIIRIGTYGCLSEDCFLNKTVVLATKSLTSSNIGKNIGYKKKMVECDATLLEVATNSIEKLNKKVLKTPIYTTDVFYSKENRKPYLKKGCVGVEMEMYALYAIAKTLNKRAIGILAANDNANTGEVLSKEDRKQGIDDIIVCALETAINLK